MLTDSEQDHYFRLVTFVVEGCPKPLIQFNYYLIISTKGQIRPTPRCRVHGSRNISQIPRASDKAIKDEKNNSPSSVSTALSKPWCC